MDNIKTDDGNAEKNKYCEAVKRFSSIAEKYHLLSEDLVEIIEMGMELFLQKQFKKSVKEGE